MKTKTSILVWIVTVVLSLSGLELSSLNNSTNQSERRLKKNHRHRHNNKLSSKSRSRSHNKHSSSSSDENQCENGFIWVVDRCCSLTLSEMCGIDNILYPNICFAEAGGQTSFYIPINGACCDQGITYDAGLEICCNPKCTISGNVQTDSCDSINPDLTYDPINGSCCSDGQEYSEEKQFCCDKKCLLTDNSSTNTCKTTESDLMYDPLDGECCDEGVAFETLFNTCCVSKCLKIDNSLDPCPDPTNINYYDLIDGNCCEDDQEYYDTSDKCCDKKCLREDHSLTNNCETTNSDLTYDLINGSCCSDGEEVSSQNTCCDPNDCVMDSVTSTQYQNECEAIDSGGSNLVPCLTASEDVCYCPQTVVPPLLVDFSSRILVDFPTEADATAEGHPLDDIISGTCASLTSPVCISISQTNYESKCRALADGYTESDFEHGQCCEQKRKLCIVRKDADGNQHESKEAIYTNECDIDADLNSANFSYYFVAPADYYYGETGCCPTYNCKDLGLNKTDVINNYYCLANQSEDGTTTYDELPS